MWFMILLLAGVFIGAVLWFRDAPAGLLDATLSTPQTSRLPRQYTIYYDDGVFTPTNMRILQGDQVIFRNESSSTLRIKGDGIDSGDFLSHSTWMRTFVDTGTFSYYNVYQESEKGMITVR